MLSFASFNYPHRRFNPLKNEWLIVSPHRASRPWQGQCETPAQESIPSFDPTNPLCPTVKRSSGCINPDYDRTFVFENDFPALFPANRLPSCDKSVAKADDASSPLFQTQSIAGECRVMCFHKRYYLYAETKVGLLVEKIRSDAAKRKFAGHAFLPPMIKQYGDLEIIVLPCAYDNYCYAVKLKMSNEVVLIDVGHAEVVVDFLVEHNLTPVAILTTHKHWDHCLGNGTLADRYVGIEIYGSRHEKAYYVNRYIDHKCQLLFGALRFTCLHTPGHTKGCVTYLLHGSAHNSPDSIFTGDFIFSSGIGRIFDSTIEEMLKSIDIIFALKSDTLIWHGHEAALENTKYEYSLDRDNVALLNRYINFLHLKQEKVPLVPTTLKEEKVFNPFFRTMEPGLLKSLGLLKGDSDDMASLKNSPDLFRLRVIALDILMHYRKSRKTTSKIT